MTLPSSGAISLGDIQGEFGGSNPISISEYYGVATGVPASGAISFSDFHGTSSGPVDSATVTVGEFTDFALYRGFRGGMMGSISNNQFAPKSNATILELYYYATGGSGTGVVFTLNGTHTNAGWTSVKIGSTTYTRSSADFSQSGGQTSWSWIASDPFSSTGTNTNVVWN